MQFMCVCVCTCKCECVYVQVCYRSLHPAPTAPPTPPLPTPVAAAKVQRQRRSVGAFVRGDRLTQGQRWDRPDRCEMCVRVVVYVFVCVHLDRMVYRAWRLGTRGCKLYGTSGMCSVFPVNPFWGSCFFFEGADCSREPAWMVFATVSAPRW